MSVTSQRTPLRSPQPPDNCLLLSYCFIFPSASRDDFATLPISSMYIRAVERRKLV